MHNWINTLKRPESVLVLVYTESGEVLMRHSRQPDDFWQPVTGSLEQGETLEQTAWLSCLIKPGYW